MSWLIVTSTNASLFFLEEENNSDSNCGGKHAPLREQDRFLPIANIAKIMKKAIPDNGKVSKCRKIRSMEF